MTTQHDGRGGYTDPRAPGLELRWEARYFELWFHGVHADSYEIFDDQEAALISDATALVVAQAIFDELVQVDETLVKRHYELHGFHDCDLATVCPDCLDCATVGRDGCQCARCLCSAPGHDHGLARTSFRERVRAAGRPK